MRTEPNYARALTTFREQARLSGELRILDLYEAEPDRMSRMSLHVAGLYLDLSRHRVPLQAMPEWERLVQTSRLTDKRDAMFAGQVINETESRSVFHVALRAPDGAHLSLGPGGEAVSAEIEHTRARMRDYAVQIRRGDRRGARGQRIRHVVNVGIGGSQLGPLLACDALDAFADGSVQAHFLANIDPESWRRISARLDPDETIAIIASKSWRTVETARNAQAVRAWFQSGGIADHEMQDHLVGVTANPEGAMAFGLSDNTIFPFRDWVGGRYSLWSAIGLPVALVIGPQGFDQMLAGAHAMDRHFREAPWHRNAPILMALLSMWNADALGSQTEAVIPYAQALARLPAYLQQLQMESNGKRVHRDGSPLEAPASPVIWGEPGTDAQHSFFQSLHQSPQVQPVDFILVKPESWDPQERALGLLANGIAQAEALLHGQPDVDDPHKRYPGNRPSTTILLPRLDPWHFGALISLYEHKTAAQGWLLDINSFDQWGVELGKKIATKHEALLGGASDPMKVALDPSIAALHRELSA
ncbi:MAG: glucose-6-phosphate isomerase [Burkholderiaceae bacterium]